MDAQTVQSTMESVVPWITRYGLQVIGAIAILIIGRIASGIAGNLTARALDRGKADPSLKGFVVGFVRLGILAFAVIAALAKFGVQTTSFVAVLGAAGFAIGMALQGSLGNFASGVLLLVFRPIRVGDLVKIAGYVGHVDEIGIFVTTINTLDYQRVIVPNGKITGDVINNINGNGMRRVDLTAGISYGSDMEKAKGILNDILASHPKVRSDPAPTVAVVELGDSSVNFVVRPWCDAGDYWTVWFEVTQTIKERFDAEGVSIPFPQRDVHLFQAAPAA
jgi:small conductance mechanosensitive channel